MAARVVLVHVIGVRVPDTEPCGDMSERFMVLPC